MKTSEKIINYLKTQGQARGRDLSDYLGISDRAVRKHLAKLLKDGNLDKVGTPPKVFYFIKNRKNINKFSKHEGLGEEQIEELKQVFLSEGVAFAYLFGSRAVGSANKNSDYDIAVYLQENISPKDFFDIRMNLIRKVGKVLSTDKLDLVLLNQIKSSFFKFVIIKEGDLIFDNNYPLRIDVELKIIQAYQDYKPTIDAYNQRMIEELKIK